METTTDENLSLKFIQNNATIVLNDIYKNLLIPFMYLLNID